MSKTNQLIEEVLRLDKKALHGPWYIDDSYDMVTRALNNYHDPIVLRLDSGMYGTAKDPHIQLIMHYRSSAPKLAKMLEVAMKALNSIYENPTGANSSLNHENNWTRWAKDRAEKALEEIEEIAGNE